MGSWDGQDDWFGGQIQQIATLEGKGSRYVIRLGPMKKQRSHRFSRFCGSRRILQLRIEHELILKEGAAIKRFLQQKFVLCGRIFVPFHVKHDNGKHNNVYMVETNEDLRRKPSIEAGDNYRISFSEFINWHNPPEYNYKQVRLYFSPSVFFNFILTSHRLLVNTLHDLPLGYPQVFLPSSLRPGIFSLSMISVGRIISQIQWLKRLSLIHI